MKNVCSNKNKTNYKNITILCFAVKKWMVVWAQIGYFALRFQEKNGGFDTRMQWQYPRSMYYFFQSKC